MSFDIVFATETILVSIAGIIFAYAAYRAFEIARVLVSPIYRSRAYLTAAVAGFIGVETIVGIIPPLSFLGGPFAFTLGFVLLGFVDSSVRVARELDFFHSDILRWASVRKPMYLILLVSTAIVTATLLVAGVQNGSTGSIPLLFLAGVGQYFFVLAFVLSYPAAALIKGARRIPEKSMKSFIRMLGFTLLCVVLSFTVWIPFDFIGPNLSSVGSAVSDVFTVVAGYYIYRAAMSLSPIGRVESLRDEESPLPTSRPVQPMELGAARP